jgi:hypothetical protein
VIVFRLDSEVYLNGKGEGMGGTLLKRLAVIAQKMEAVEAVAPVPVILLPSEDDPGYSDALAEARRLEKSGEPVIVVRTVNCRLRDEAEVEMAP